MTALRLDRRLLSCLSLLSSATALAFTGCAHSIPSPDAKPAREAAAMTATTPGPVPGDSALSAEEIGERFLKLIGGLESRSDLSLERIRAATGISLTVEPGSLGAVYWSSDLGGGWRYALTSVSLSPSLLNGISLDFVKSDERFAPMPDAICVLDFDHYHNALQAMGFRAVEIRGEIGQLENWRYYKGDITLSILPQNAVPGAAGRLCVKSIGTLN